MHQKRSIKAAFFDIDGTLRSMETHEILQSTIDALKALKEQGIKLFISTGRMRRSIPEIAIDFDGFITVNGSFCITSQESVLQEFFLPESDLNRLITFAENEKITCRFVTHHQIRCNFLTDPVWEVYNKVKTSVPTEGDLKELISEGVLQASVYADEEIVKEAVHQLMPACYASSWSPLFSDVNKKGASKQTGMDQFLAYYNIDVSETIAFGDGGNDLSMLKHAAIGVAMGNGQIHVKEAADYVTDTVENDGIAKALTHFGLFDFK